MLPGTTDSPPNFFNARRLACESRPLRDERLLFYVPLLTSSRSWQPPSGGFLGCALAVQHPLSTPWARRPFQLGRCGGLFSLAAGFSALARRPWRSGFLGRRLLFGLFVADRDDLEDRQLLAMTGLAAVVVPAALLKTTTLSDFAWATISAPTMRPAVDSRFEPSPASSTSVMSTESPASPASFSTTILSPGATRYCLPPCARLRTLGHSLP